MKKFIRIYLALIATFILYLIVCLITQDGEWFLNIPYNEITIGIFILFQIAIQICITKIIKIK